MCAGSKNVGRFETALVVDNERGRTVDDGE
jgi:hypothetical protein